MRYLKPLLCWSAFITAAAVLAAFLVSATPVHAHATTIQAAHALGASAFLVGATLDTQWPNLLDVAQRLDPDGS